mmetsp:Transcript_10409/g.19007  ORF Transcript_10409/g.19007 Transcript_10409/m.19007 type:complete len:211 (+) Transcript_10409:217-849(+)
MDITWSTERLSLNDPKSPSSVPYSIPKTRNAKRCSTTNPFHRGNICLDLKDSKRMKVSKTQPPTLPALPHDERNVSVSRVPFLNLRRKKQRHRKGGLLRERGCQRSPAVPARMAPHAVPNKNVTNMSMWDECTLSNCGSRLDTMEALGIAMLSTPPRQGPPLVPRKEIKKKGKCTDVNFSHLPLQPSNLPSSMVQKGLFSPAQPPHKNWL